MLATMADAVRAVDLLESIRKDYPSRSDRETADDAVHAAFEGNFVRMQHQAQQLEAARSTSLIERIFAAGFWTPAGSTQH